MRTRPIITMTTDFGEADYYVGSMKGVILSIQPEAEIVDLSHQIHAQDILDGAFLISQVYRLFPPKTIHLVVVDPGVGTSRRPLIVSADEHFFVAPDNGILSLVYARAEAVRAIHVTATHYFRDMISDTFHGRDVFAPVAAWLARGIALEKFGEDVVDLVRFKLPEMREDGKNHLWGAVIKVDHFGNCVTNITQERLPDLFSPNHPAYLFRVADQVIHKVFRSYAEAVENSPFIIVGSSGFLEIAMNRSSAADALKISRGTEVEVSW
jgi:hypothetical protein